MKKIYVKNPSVSLDLTLVKNEKVEHYIRIKTHKLIALRFSEVESSVNVLCGWAEVSLVFYLPSETNKWYQMVKTGSDECSMVLVSKVFLAKLPGKRVPLRRTTVQKMTEKECSWLGMLPREGECTNVVEETHP